ncbi:PIR3 protein precursor [Shigella dysenteriae 1617]|uniref:PIR3 protein n=1 Tax=Shigella dysenteriae 1617 TaxID=754093 RepID=A0A0A6ZXC6_SHIDY|nr:PIR3 protein precursor [Shigella dysenteriae 1617]
MKRLIMATMVTAILASSTVWAADNAPVAAQQQTQQVQQTQKTAAAERISEQGLYAMRDVQVARLALFHGDPEKAKELTNEASALLSDDSTEWAKFAKPGKKTNLNDDQYIVINASVGISESYVATPEKEAAIKIANEKMAKGDKKIEVKDLTPSSRQFFMTTIRQVVVIKLFGARGSINSHFIFLKVNRNNPVSSQII